jgi:tRNA(Ile)-lysidine synthase
MGQIDDFATEETIAVAVSGGADSTALLLLTNEWAKFHNKKIIALTVNHNLRPEALAEAMQIKKWCDAKNIKHHILHWEHSQTITSSIQEAARDARYHLLTEFCKKNQISNLLIAHHLDDQIETFFFRLARGSGLMGLACMSPKTNKNGVFVLRPLLSSPKSRLISTLKTQKQDWIEDPSNQNSTYTRVHIRKQLQSFLNDKIMRTRIANLITKLAKFRRELEKYMNNELTNAIEFSSTDHVILHLDKKISENSLGKLVQILTETQYPPRTSKLKKIHLEISHNLQKKRTFAGLLFEPITDGKIIIRREKKFSAKPLAGSSFFAINNKVNPPNQESKNRA